MRANRSAQRLSVHRPWAMWLVLCVLVLSACMPTVTRALVWSETGPWQEICTANGGAVWVSATPESTQDGAANGQAPLPSLDHCPFCLQPTDRSAAPPPHQAYLFLASGGIQLRPVRQAFFFSIDIHRAPPARGPPAFT
ncbi:MAG: DUF2946 domain-containing protein [Curvibacter sp.]|nr:MAG: DUF2946 domain-containing protein [Curvibacter sp.]